MKKPALLDKLAASVAAAKRSAHYCVEGSLPELDPGIEIAKFGRLTLPLTEASADALTQACKQAPYGKGRKTFVDRSVRDTLELSPSQLTITNPAWKEAIAAAVRSIALSLDLPEDRLQPQLYKLLLYRGGGFFRAHRDSEKIDGMVASLIVALPSPFEGGTLKVRHQGETHSIDFVAAAQGKAPCYAAFYADCEHEVYPVHAGFRVCLAYNLALAGAASGRRKPAGDQSPKSALSQSIATWTETMPDEPLIFALDHHYTQRSLSLDLLKGADRSAADLILAAAEESDCEAFFCNVSRHVIQDAQDGSWDRRWRSQKWSASDLELGDIYEDDLYGEHWVDAAGKDQKFPAIGLRLSAIVSNTPLAEWQPTQEEYEGYTGNAGNTLDRWYHRSALCLWHCDQHFSILAKASSTYAIDLLDSLMKKLAKTPKKRLDDAKRDCIRLAQAILKSWPMGHRQSHDWRSPVRTEEKSPPLPQIVATLDDIETSRQLLHCANDRQTSWALSGFINGICRKHGCATFADDLLRFFAPHSVGIGGRDLNWLDDFAQAKSDDPDRQALLRKLTGLATSLFCQPKERPSWQTVEPLNEIRLLVPMLRTAILADDEASLQRLIAFVQNAPDRFPIGKVQIPTLERLAAWLHESERAWPPAIAAWLASLEESLTTVTASAPQPPADFKRSSRLSCTCHVCQELATFLADPKTPATSIRANENGRAHILNRISKDDCDVSDKLDKSTRPFALVLTKNTDSFDRLKKQYDSDCHSLEAVRVLRNEKR